MDATSTLQVIVIPTHRGNVEYHPEVIPENDRLFAAGRDIVERLCAAGIRAEGNFRANYKAGWKYEEYETRGVPLRIEFGHRDLAANRVILWRLDTRRRSEAPMDELVSRVRALLGEIDMTINT